MPIEDLVHVGVALVVDQQGTALKGRWTVYVGSVDVREGDVDLNGAELPADQAAARAHAEAIEWLEIEAATKRPPTPSVPPVDAPQEEPESPSVAAPTTPRRSPGKTPRRRKGSRGPVVADSGILAAASLDVPGPVDPPPLDLADDLVPPAEDPPADRPRQRRKRCGSVSDRVPSGGRDDGELA